MRDRYRSLSLERRRAVIVSLMAELRALPVDDPGYLEALHETLTGEAEEFRAAAATLREQAREVEGTDKVGELRRQAVKADQDARRRLRQVRNGGNAASVWRVRDEGRGRVMVTGAQIRVSVMRDEPPSTWKWVWKTL